ADPAGTTWFECLAELDDEGRREVGHAGADDARVGVADTQSVSEEARNQRVLHRREPSGHHGADRPVTLRVGDLLARRPEPDDAAGSAQPAVQVIGPVARARSGEEAVPGE